MTSQEIESIRRNAAIEGELRIIEAIPHAAFSGVVSPHLLGAVILKNSVARIRDLIND